MNNSECLTKIIEMDKLILTICELDELKELIFVNKYFNDLIYQIYPKLNKTFKILQEYIVYTKIPQRDNYFWIKVKQVKRRLYEFIFQLLRKK